MVNLTLFCLVDGGSASRAFSVEIASDDTVGDLKDLIRAENAVKFKDLDANQLTLWQVSIPAKKDDFKHPIVLNALNEKKRLHPTTCLSEISADIPPEDAIHIIVQRPSQGNQRPHERHQRNTKHILSSRPLNICPISIPEHALARASNGGGNQRSREQRGIVVSAKSWKDQKFTPCVQWNSWYRETRYGRELYNALKEKLSATAKEKGIIYSPHYYYMMLDFARGVSLTMAEVGLGAEHTLGLRLAYAHFFQDKYEGGFPSFVFKALKHKELFTIARTIIAIHDDLELPKQQPLFLFLHIDEFQTIFDYS
ncbi:hypothetical protein BGZ51_008892 [Haplosporangium sp. Z 767]|nr:hypothetical protein BGZ51_008892 [Haplosporangium sp. Z 767]KAF9177851.1 hypothetical protein BGZ50_008306 [Haplosporangium sp. Z 11]